MTGGCFRFRAPLSSAAFAARGSAGCINVRAVVSNPFQAALVEVQAGRQSAESLLPLVYADMKRLAAASLRRLPAGQTLQPTALVHETWLKLVGEEDPGWEGRRHFFGAAAQAMRELIVDYQRRKSATKRLAPGGVAELESELQPAAVLPEMTDVLAVDAALVKLEAENAEAAEVVVLSFFGGLSLPEIAELKQVGLRTVERRWQFARAWLVDALAGGH